MPSSYETRALELTEAGAPKRIAQTRAAAEFLRDRGMSLEQAVDNGVLTVNDDLRENIDEEFLQRLLKKMGLGAQMRQGGTRVQSLLFPKDKFTIPESRKWARDHNFSVKKAVTEGNFRRLRILDPNECGSIRTMKFGRGIRALLCIK